MMRYFINTIKIIALICGLLFLTFVIINWGDEDLKPEVAQILSWQAPTNALDDNGYLVLLGIEAPLEMDASIIGKRRYRQNWRALPACKKYTKKHPRKHQIQAKLTSILIGKPNNAITKNNKIALTFIYNKIEQNLLWL